MPRPSKPLAKRTRPKVTPETPSPSGVLAVIPDTHADLIAIRDEAARALGLTASLGDPNPQALEARSTPFAMMIESLSEIDPVSKAPRYNGKLRFMTIVREMSRSAPSSKHAKMIEAWDRLTPAQQRGVDLLDLCHFASLDPHILAGQVFAYLSRLGADIGGMLASLAYPEIVRTTLEVARTPLGIDDRKIVHAHFGFTPQPRGATVINGPQINQQAGAGSTLVAGQINGASDFEKLMMDEDSQEGRGAGAIPSVDAEVVSEDGEFEAEVEEGGESDESDETSEGEQTHE